MENANTVYIRECRSEDITAIEELERLCFGNNHALPKIALRQYFDICQSAFCVAEISGRLIGFAVGAVTSGKPNDGWILDVAVHPDFRMKGVAKALIENVKEVLEGFGVNLIRATVSLHNKPSITMLTKANFKVVEEVPEYFGKGQPRLIMEINLRGT
jgi:ribosomal-protein-alanine N-acetyltransferase